MAKGKKPRLGSGKRFKALSSSVAGSYRKKGMSKKRADYIGGAVAGKAGRKKYGARRMAKMAGAGRRRKR